jgi:hypothetical protein
MSSKDRQDKLNELYAPLVDLDSVYRVLDQAEDADRVLAKLDGPFLIATNEQYERACPKVVIVGQENYGWIPNYLSFLQTGSVEKALKIYREFDIGDYGTWFGRGFRMIRDRILGNRAEGEKRSVIWSNLFKFNHEGLHSIHSPHYTSMLNLQRDVFQKELATLRPDVAILLTGPDYDFVIERFYPGVRFESIGCHPKNEIAGVFADGLPGGNWPGRTFRAYHPESALHWKPQTKYTYDVIVEEIKKDFP